MYNPALAAALGSAVNWATVRDLYPTASGPTTSEIGGANTPYTTDPSAALGAAGATSVDDTAAAPSGRTLLGQPITWFVVLIALFVALAWAGKKVGGEAAQTGFSNLKLSAYNILFIGLAAALFVGAMKVVFSRVKVPGLTEYVQAL